MMITVVDLDLTPADVAGGGSAAYRILAYKKQSLDDTYPSAPYQDTNQRVHISMRTTPACAGLKVYLNVWDIDDKSPYEPDQLVPDNVLTAGLVQVDGYQLYTDPQLGTYTYSDAAGNIKVDLNVGDKAGDNFVVTAHPIRPSPSSLNDKTGNLVVWKRVYIENDSMYKVGSDLRTNFVADQDSNPDTLALEDVSWCSTTDNMNDITVFDAAHPAGENAQIVAINTSTKEITLDRDLQNSYTCLYTANGQGAAVGLNNTGFYQADMSLLTNTYGDFANNVEGTDGGAFCEFVSRPEYAGHVPLKKALSDASTPSLNQFVAKWFGNWAQLNYMELVGACHEAYPGDLCLGNTKPVASACFIYVDEIAAQFDSNPTLVNESTVCHETGHQWFDLSTTDTNHNSVPCHLGPGTEYCTMSSNRDRLSGILEFCTDHILLARRNPWQ